MAQLQAQVKRGILDELWYAGQKSALSLEDSIRGFKSARWDSIQTGSFVVNTAGGGYSVSFHVPELFRQLGPDQFFALGQEFLEILTDARATLTTAGQDPTNDALCFSAMMLDDRLQTIRSSMLDTTALRYPYASSSP